MTRLTFQRSGLIMAVMLTVWVLMAGSAAAQDNDCAAQADAALRQLALNCANLDSNQACYGWSEVSAVFDPDAQVSSDAFSRPADRAGLVDLVSLETSAFNLSDKSWGIAVLNAQGNLPLTVTPPGMVFIMLGDVTVTNGVSADMMLRVLAQPLAVTIGDALDAYAVPPTGNSSTRPVAMLPANTIIQIDGVTPGGQWLRIAYQTDGGSPFAWVNAETVWERQTSLEAPGVAVQGLPEIEPGARGPMQTFFLRTGIEAPACAAVPPALLYVQIPDGVAADITVNGVSLRVEGVVILRLVPDGSAPSGFALRVFVPSGLTVLYAGTDSAILLPPAFAVQAPLEFDQNGNLLISDGFTPIAPVGGAELDALQGLERLPENLLNFPAFIPAVTIASTVGRANPVYFFDEPDRALAQTRVLCPAGALSSDVCAMLLAGEGG